MNLVKGQSYRVRLGHRFHPGRLGIFEFMGEGPSAGVVVLCDPQDHRIRFAVLASDLEPS